MTIDQIKELAGHRDVSPWVIKLVQDAVEIECEACAKKAEEWLASKGRFLVGLAAAIRARGDK